jgi:hypothetical protein
MNCRWEACEGGQRCVVCDRRLKLAAFSPHLLANCRAPEPSEPIAVAGHCVHRSDEPARFEACKLCGLREVPVGVYTCQRHGECTTHAYGLRNDSGKPLAVCIGCRDYAT